MADLFDYLKWRGDVPFTVDPFNEVDNLVLAELAYAHLDGIITGSFDRVPLREVDEKYFEDHSREDAVRDGSHIVRSALLMDGMLSGKRFGSVKLMRYVNTVNADKDMQMAALTFLLPDGSVYISFRGTDSTVVGWKEDLNMSYMPVTEGQRSAVRYLNETAARLRRPIRVGGHSKGGNFAVFASAFCEPKIRDRIVAVYTNDGPGFRRETRASAEYRSILPKVVSIVPDTSIIGMLLTNEVRHRIVKSNEKGISQHDALSWQIERNRFVSAEQSALGQFISRSQQDWLSKIDDESRALFVDTVFSVIESTGMDTFGEMENNKLISVERMLNSIKGLSRERQKEIMSIFGELVQSSTQAARSAISDMDIRGWKNE